jgi:hypothetical protein
MTPRRLQIYAAICGGLANTTASLPAGPPRQSRRRISSGKSKGALITMTSFPIARHAIRPGCAEPFPLLGAGLVVTASADWRSACARHVGGDLCGHVVRHCAADQSGSREPHRARSRDYCSRGPRSCPRSKRSACYHWSSQPPALASPHFWRPDGRRGRDVIICTWLQAQQMRRRL